MTREYAKRTDANVSEIVSLYRQVGAFVAFIEGSYNAGIPDLLVGFRGKTYLVEVKTKKGRLNKAQIAFREQWVGGPLVVVRNPEEALAAIGLTDIPSAA